MDQPHDERQIWLSPDMACRLAAIDIGSNSVRLFVAEALRGGAYRILDEEREPTRLGRSVSSLGRLDDESMEKTLAALRSFKEIAAGYQVSMLRTIATCAVRESRNGPEFCRRVREEVGLEIEVISGEREARLAFASVQNAFDLAGRNVVMADIGGGSTEIVFATGNLIESIFSTPLGAVRLTEQFSLADPQDAAAFQQSLDQLEAEITTVLKKQTARPLFAPHLLVGCGGTFTTLGEVVMAAKRAANLPVAGYQVSHAEVRHLLDRLRKLPLRARRAMPGMTPDRADIIIAGLSIVDALMKRFRVNLLAVHTRGVRDGLVREMIDELQEAAQPAGDEAALREAAIERLAAACSGELEHGRQVALLAVLAHTGSYLPVASARIDLCDRIFTRIGASDDLARGQSTFMVEMSETANILNNATRRSLIILDEIGRGTSTFDGLSLAWSIVEHLHHQVGAKSLFATHYHELTELASPHVSGSPNSQDSASERASGRLPRVRNYNVAVREWNDQIIFLRKIQPGPADKSYGIQVARLAGVPRPVIDRAKTILRVLEEAELNLQHVAAPDSGSPGETDPGSGRSRRVRRLERDALQELTPPPQLDLFS